jgi:hypothetical protein
MQANVVRVAELLSFTLELVLSFLAAIQSCESDLGATHLSLARELTVFTHVRSTRFLSLADLGVGAP